MNLTKLNLPLDLKDPETEMMVGSAVSWVKANTTFDPETAETIPDNVRLFVLKYCDIMSRNGVSSESIAGMSQSFSGDSVASLLRQIAAELLVEYGYSACKFYPAKRRW